MIKREIMTTADGSNTIHMPELNEQYHSKHGALQEALHVFIAMGLAHKIKHLPSGIRDGLTQAQPLHILEYGFGTGLNAMLTAQYDSPVPIHYTGVEAYPINQDEIKAMDYGTLLEHPDLYQKIHLAPWDQSSTINHKFELLKLEKTFEEMQGQPKYDLIYFDAFGPRTQPELWTVAIFDAAFKALKSCGVLVTYCAAGEVRRNLQEVGFEVERLPGPPGKREMLRASKK